MFLNFMKPPCSLMDEIHLVLWKVLGILQLISGVLIWRPKYTKYVSGIFFVFMLIFTIVHLVYNTYDIGGALFKVLLLGLLTWNPEFIRKKLF
jgi:tryptophan-rich sensory protein